MHRSFSSPRNGTPTKAERLIAREDRRERKAERKAIRHAEYLERRAAGLRGAPIDGMPEAYQGLARTLSYGDDHATP